MDKYDKAIEFLQAVEPGSYFDECAEIIEELVAQVEAKKKKRYVQTADEIARAKRNDGGAIYYMKARNLL
jgi:hypothetical protein